MSYVTDEASGRFSIAFKVWELEDKEHVVCRGMANLVLIEDGKSPKDHIRDWHKFLCKQYDPKKYSVNVWWRPDE